MVARPDDKKTAKWLMVLGLSAFFTLNVVYDHFGGWDAVWYIGQSSAFVCYSLALWFLTKSLVAELLVVVTVGQLADEIFGDPTQPDGVEYWFFGGYVVFIIIKYLLKRLE